MTRPAETALEGRLAEAERTLSVLRKVYAVLAGEPDLDKTLRHVVDEVADALAADVCAFLLHDETANELVTQTGAHGLPIDDEPLLYRVRLDDPLTSSGRVFLMKEPFLSDDAQNDPAVNPRYARLWGYRSLIVAPLVVDGRSIGVLRVGRRQPNTFTQDHLRLAVLVAEHAAVVIANARLYRRFQESMRELQRLNEVKTEFLSTVSHELLSPISSVDGFLNLLMKEDVGPVNPRQRDFLTLCAKSLGRVMVLIDDLLDVSRIEAGVVKIRPETVHVEELLKAAHRDHAPAAKGKGLSFSVKSPSNLPALSADPHRVRQVVDNLLKNAFKFTPTGGKVLLSARADGKALTVSVKDTGIGLSPAEREKVFERYYQVGDRARRPQGAGLGLAICKSLVERHGGRLWVDSAPGRGSDFQFTLPIGPSVGLS